MAAICYRCCSHHAFYYLRKLLTSRGEPDNTKSIDDCQDLILLQKGRHAILDKAEAIAFLKVSNVSSNFMTLLSSASVASQQVSEDG